MVESKIAFQQKFARELKNRTNNLISWKAMFLLRTKEFEYWQLILQLCKQNCEHWCQMESPSNIMLCLVLNGNIFDKW